MVVWSSWVESNHLPMLYKNTALTSELQEDRSITVGAVFCQPLLPQAAPTPHYRTMGDLFQIIYP